LIFKMISLIEQQTSDIDWFFTAGNDIGFVASGGGLLPNGIADRSLEEIELLSDYFRNLPNRCGITLNINLKLKLTKQYLEAFTDMAEKGLFAFDKTVLNSFSDSRYHLVASPLQPLKIDELPFEIVGLLVKPKGDTKINEHLNTMSFL